MLTRSLYRAAEHFALSNEHEIHLMGQKLDELGIEDPLSESVGRLDEKKLAKARKLFGCAAGGVRPVQEAAVGTRQETPVPARAQ